LSRRHGVERFDERRGVRGDEAIAVTAQASHSGGSPMSQRECAGFNWPPLVVSAVEPICSSPEAVSRAGPANFADCTRHEHPCFVPWIAFCVFDLPDTSCACGVGQPAIFAITCSDVIAVLFAPDPSRTPIRCFIARCASTDLLSSFATAVGHPARFATSFNVT
jgi:hypothetical protein